MIRNIKLLYSCFSINCAKKRSRQVELLSVSLVVLRSLKNSSIKCSEIALQIGHYVVVFCHVNVKMLHKIFALFDCIFLMLSIQQANQEVLPVPFVVLCKLFWYQWAFSVNFDFNRLCLQYIFFRFFKQLHLWVFRNECGHSTSSPQSVSHPYRAIFFLQKETCFVVSVSAITIDRLFDFNIPTNPSKFWFFDFIFCNKVLLDLVFDSDFNCRCLKISVFCFNDVFELFLIFYHLSCDVYLVQKPSQKFIEWKKT